MSTGFRPPESSSIDEGLRIRLEGGVELLEDALPLLDSLTLVMQRETPNLDDLATLRECLNQLPRIDEAIDKANRHEQASGLTREVGARLNKAYGEANDRLRQLGHDEAPSLRAAVSAVLALVKGQGRPPGPHERLLMSSPGVPWLLSLGIGGGVAGLVVAAGFQGGALFGALACVITLFATATRPWFLMVDRLHFPPKRGELARDVLPANISKLSLQGASVVAESGGEVIVLRSAMPRHLMALLCLLKSPLLSGVRPTAGWSTVLDAIDENTKESGRALLTLEGVFFVPNSRKGLLLQALTDQALPGVLSLDEVLTLFTHVPAERWPAVAEHLRKKADAQFFPKGGTAVEDSANTQLGISIRAQGQQVRLNYSGNVTDLVEVRALLERLVG